MREDILGFCLHISQQAQPLFISWITLSLERPTLGLAPTLEAPHSPNYSRTALAVLLPHLVVGYMRSLLWIWPLPWSLNILPREAHLFPWWQWHALTLTSLSPSSLSPQVHSNGFHSLLDISTWMMQEISWVITDHVNALSFLLFHPKLASPPEFSISVPSLFVIQANHLEVTSSPHPTNP